MAVWNHDTRILLIKSISRFMYLEPLPKWLKIQVVFQVGYFHSNLFVIADNGRSHLMLNTIKRDKRRADKLRFDRFTQEQDLVERMKKEIEDLQEEVKQNKFKITEADYHKNILGEFMTKE